jgi:HEAT repeat protein
MATRPSLNNGVPIPYDNEVEELRRRVKNPGPEAWAACLALGYKADKNAFEILEELAVSDDWRYRRSAIEAMAVHRLALTRIAFFCGCLEDPSPYVVRTACQVVADLKLDDAHDSLRKLVHSGAADTRIAALRALKELWKPSDYALVFSVFQSDVSEQVRRQATWTLRSNVDKGNWVPLFEAWRADPLHRHRVWACELAGKFGGNNLSQTLKAMLKDPDGHVSKAAARALERLSI